ncbi:MAG: CRTAC1 family protein [Gemmataceae bacterium]
MSGKSRLAWSLLALVALTGAGLGVWWRFFHTGTEPQPEPPSPVRLSPTAGVPWFVDVTKEAGIQFKHFDGTTDIEYIMDTMGSGVAWIDYDADGWPDLFLMQGGPLRPDKASAQPTNKLYRNNRDGTFTDVTEQVGLARSGVGFGCAVGDFDNDGYDDLVVTYFKGVYLYHNEPDGKGGRRFRDITAESGIDNPHWATSAAWADIDGDGLLDLYICNYVIVDIDKYTPCFNRDVKKYFGCPPNSFESTHHKLYKNLGGGKFADVSVAAGITKPRAAPGLAVVIVDLDDDGLPDIYVANDMQPAYLFHNQGGGKFVEKAMRAGCATQPSGRFIAGMGIATGDFDGSGRPSLFVTNFQRFPNMFFLNKGKMNFDEWNNPSGLTSGGTDHLAFGAEAFDADLDGNLDLAIADGHVTRHAKEIFGDTFKQESRLFLGLGKARFKEVTPLAGPYFHEKHVGRGVASADFNNDGKPDLVITHNAERPALLRNDTPTDNHWLRLDLVGDGKKSNRNAIGARVEVEVAGRKLVRFIHGGGGYASASERTLLIGLAGADKADRVTVRWPSGVVQSFGPFAGNAGYRLHEDGGKAEKWR